MSSPSDPDQQPAEPPPMTVMAAVGWSFGVTFGLILLRSLTLSVRPGSTNDLVAQIACQAISYLLGLFLILRVHSPDASIRDTIGLRPTHVAFYPLAILLGVAIEIPADGLYDLIVRRFPTGIEDHFVEMYRDSSTPRRALFGLLIIAVGPALEEMLFRGALFRLLAKANPIDTVIGVTAMLFAVAHLEWQMFLPIGIVGLALAFMRNASGSIVPSLLLHGSFNAMSFALMARSKPGATESTAFPPNIVAAAAGVALLLLGVAHLVGRRSLVATSARELDRR
ncbi:MAG: CPBP family intramembrane metalloprotease [Minicystis sp.]